MDDFLEAFEDSDSEGTSAARVVADARIRALEDALLSGDAASLGAVPVDAPEVVRQAFDATGAILRGDYGAVLRSEVGNRLLGYVELESMDDVYQVLRQRVSGEVGEGPEAPARAYACLCVAVAAFQVFLQVNYTGPMLSMEDLDALALPPLFEDLRREAEEPEQEPEPEADGPEEERAVGVARQPELQLNAYHAAVARAAVRTLAADGLDPYARAGAPQLLLVARCLGHTLGLPRLSPWPVPVLIGNPNQRPRGGVPVPLTPAEAAKGRARLELCEYEKPALDPDAVPDCVAVLDTLVTAPLWAARTTVAHARLLFVTAADDVPTLWYEIRAGFGTAALRLQRPLPPLTGSHDERGPLEDLRASGAADAGEARLDWAAFAVEYGLAQHYLRVGRKGKEAFFLAQGYSHLGLQLTGALARKLKSQQRDIAILRLAAQSRLADSEYREFNEAAPVVAPSLAGGTVSVAEGEDVGAAGALEVNGGVNGVRGEDATGPESAFESSGSMSGAKEGDDAGEAPENGILEEGEDAMSFFDRTGVAMREVQMDDIVDNNVLNRPIFKAADAVAASAEGAFAETGLRHPVEQAIVLALCLDVQNSNPADGLTGEQMHPYIEAVVARPLNWMVHSSALLERSWLECESMKRRERGLFQIQALVDQHTTRLTLMQSSAQAIEEADPVHRRLRFLHLVAYPPRWEIRRDLAQRYASLGAFAAAAEIYEELGLWEEVVDCFKVLERYARAERLLRKQLKECGGEARATPRMLVSLGDVTEDPSYFSRAWEVSGQRYSRAQIRLGLHHLGQGRLPEARDAFVLGLAVKPLQPSIWFKLGATAMQLRDWDASLNAFSQAVMQVPDAAEAWGNVGAIHMRRERYDAAYPALQEGLKHMRRNWRMWENQFITTAALGKYGEAIYICNQLLDLRDARSAERHMRQGTRADFGGESKRPEFSLRFLGMLVKKVVVDGDAGLEVSHERLLQRLGELLARAVNTLPSDPMLWEVMSLYEVRQGDAQKVLDCRLKQCRAARARPRWERDAADTKEVLRCLAKYARAALETATPPQIYDCKMFLRAALRQVDPAAADPEDLSTAERLQAQIEARFAENTAQTSTLENITDL